MFCTTFLLRQYNKLKRRKKVLPSKEFVLPHYLLYVTPFLNKTNLSKFFCALRSGFQRAYIFLFINLFKFDQLHIYSKDKYISSFKTFLTANSSQLE